MRVALYTDSDAFAGTERHMLDLARGLISAGCGVSVVCPGDSPLAERCRWAGLPTEHLAKGPVLDWSAAARLARWCRAGRFDLIHAHNGHAMLAAVLAKRRLAWVDGSARPAAVATQHFISPSQSRRRGLARAASDAGHRFISSGLDRVIAISEAVARGQRERQPAFADRVRVVHNGVSEPAVFRPSSEVRAGMGAGEGEFVLLCAARLEAEKGLETLVDAMGRVASPKVRLLIAGRGRLEAELRQRVARAGLVARVGFLGFRDDVYELMAAADAVVLPSPGEPFGLVLAEAMALCRPVLAVNGGAPPEIIEHGVSGLLAEPGNSDSMASMIDRLAGDASGREGLARAGRLAYEQRFTADRMAQATARVYEEALAAARFGTAIGHHTDRPGPGRAGAASGEAAS